MGGTFVQQLWTVDILPITLTVKFRAIGLVG